MNEDLLKVTSELHHFSILELTHINSFNPDPSWIAKKLGISEQKAALAVERLIRLGFLIQDGQELLHIGRGIPDFQNLAGTVDVELKFKTYPSSSTSITTTSTVSTSTTKFDIRGRGRQGQLTIRSDAIGDYWRFGTLRLDVQPDGGR